MYFFFPVGHRNKKFKTTLLGEVTELTLRLKLLRQTLPQSWFLREGERVGCRGWGWGRGGWSLTKGVRTNSAESRKEPE